MSSQSREKLIIGHISGIYGVQGWIKIFSHTEPRENILSYTPWYLKVSGEWKPFEVLDGNSQQGGKAVVAKLSGISDRETARNYMGCDIAIDKTQLPHIDDGYYWLDLIGSQVINEDGVDLGSVESLLETGAHDVLRIKGNEDYILIPFVIDEFIQAVDTENKLIKVKWNLSED